MEGLFRVDHALGFNDDRGTVSKSESRSIIFFRH
jgi:hypothetical protein